MTIFGAGSVSGIGKRSVEDWDAPSYVDEKAKYEEDLKKWEADMRRWELEERQRNAKELEQVEEHYKQETQDLLSTIKKLLFRFMFCFHMASYEVLNPEQANLLSHAHCTLPRTIHIFFSIRNQSR